MRTSFSFLRSLSSLRQYSTSRSHSAIVVPVHSDQFDNNSNSSSSSLSNDLKSLPVKSPPSNSDINIITADHLFDLISSAVSSQKHAMDAISGSSHEQLMNSTNIDQHLEDGIVLLDACRSVLEKIDLIKDYVESVRTGSRLVNRGTTDVRRVNELLDNKKYCGGGVESGLERSYSSLLKRAMSFTTDEDEDDNQTVGRVLSESQSETLKACRLLESAMSFNSNKKRTSLSSLRNNRKKVVGQMGELKQVIVLAERLRDLKSDQVLDNKCDELVSVVDRLEIGVRDLYSQLISVRMMLL